MTDLIDFVKLLTALVSFSTLSRTWAAVDTILPTNDILNNRQCRSKSQAQLAQPRRSLNVTKGLPFVTFQILPLRVDAHGVQ